MPRLFHLQDVLGCQAAGLFGRDRQHEKCCCKQCDGAKAYAGVRFHIRRYLSYLINLSAACSCHEASFLQC